jgi:hypothetical protein
MKGAGWMGWDGKPMENPWKIGIFMGIFLRNKIK